MLSYIKLYSAIFSLVQLYPAMFGFVQPGRGTLNQVDRHSAPFNPIQLN